MDRVDHIVFHHLENVGLDTNRYERCRLELLGGAGIAIVTERNDGDARIVLIAAYFGPDVGRAVDFRLSKTRGM